MNKHREKILAPNWVYFAIIILSLIGAFIFGGLMQSTIGFFAGLVVSICILNLIYNFLAYVFHLHPLKYISFLATILDFLLTF
jgi:hypothetical protein